MHRVWGNRPVAYRSWAVDPSRRRSSAPSGAASTSTCSLSSPTSTSGCSQGASRPSRERRVPVRGLAAFEDSELDALFFFGRERDTEIVVANLIASRLTVLYGPSGVGKSSLLLAAVARSCASFPRSRSSSSSRTGAMTRPERSPAPSPTWRGSRLASWSTPSSARRPAHDVYLILDQAEEYFTYHDDGGRLRSGARRRSSTGRCASTSSCRCARTRSRGSTGSRADIPSLFANVLRLDRLDRAAGRAAIVRPLERWSELEGEQVVAEDVLVERVLDGVGAGRIELGPGGLGLVEGNGGGRGIEAPYLQLVMQRMWDVERASGSSTLRASTLEELGGAGQVVADHLERAIEALTPGTAGDRGPAVRPPRHAVGHQDRARGVRPRRVRRCLARRDRRGHGHARASPHPSHRRERAVGDLPRRPRRRGARLEESSRRGAGRRACPAGGAAQAPPPGVPGLRRARRARARVGAGGVRVLATQRSARSGARREGRAARRELALACSAVIPSSVLALALEAARLEPTRGRRTRSARRSTRRACARCIDVGHPLVGARCVDRSRRRALAASVGDGPRRPG